MGVVECEVRGESRGALLLLCRLPGGSLALEARREGPFHWRVEPVQQSRDAFATLTGRRFLRVLAHNKRHLVSAVEGRLEGHVRRLKPRGQGG